MTLKTALLRTHILRDCHLYVLLDALSGYYVVSGHAPTISQRAAGANMSVDATAFEYVIAGTWGEKTSTTNVSIDAADPTNPRIDLLYVNSGGTLTILKGTAAAVAPAGESTWQKWEAPYPADYSATAGVLLAEVRVPAGATSIVNADIRDCYIPLL